ncbi:hypothetical protein [Nonomuraea roseoviolacea]|uniref:hypothetical protein n=1 Tax=Nonomuraea roseoviolacea TaxID=103837 RepID=UPI0031E2E4B0
MLVQIGVAAWMCYEAIRAVTPVYPALQPILVAAICYGLTFAPPIVLLVLNASAVTACLRLLFARPQPWSPPGTFGRMSMEASASRPTKTWERRPGSRLTELPPKS